MLNVGQFQWLSQLGAQLTGTIKGKVRSVSTGHQDQYTFTAGNGASQVSEEYDDESGSLAAAGTVNIDLSGVLVDEPAAATILFTSIKYLKFVNTSANAGTVIRLGAAASNPWVGPFGSATGVFDVRPGEMTFICTDATGWAVTAATADLLKILNLDGANTATYRMYLAGNA